MRLRPHHLLDIITQYGAGIPFRPSTYGHQAHVVAQHVLGDLRQRVQLVVGADDVCEKCRYLVNGRCMDVVHGVEPPESKQEYNDRLDRAVMAHLGLREGQTLTVRVYLQHVSDHLYDLERICSHPGEDPRERQRRLLAGLRKCGINHA